MGQELTTRLFMAAGHRDISQEEARAIDMQYYPEAIDHEYKCGHVYPMFPPASPCSRCPICYTPQ